MPLLDAAEMWLHRNAPMPAAVSVVHGYAGPRNVLCADDTVLALTDWEYAHVCDPAEDWAFCVSMCASPQMPREAWMSLIDRVAGTRMSAPRWAFWEAFNLFKAACANRACLALFETGINCAPRDGDQRNGGASHASPSPGRLDRVATRTGRGVHIAARLVKPGRRTLPDMDEHSLASRTVVLIDPSSPDGEGGLGALTDVDQAVTLLLTLEGRSARTLQEFAEAEQIDVSMAGLIYLDQVARRLSIRVRDIEIISTAGSDTVGEILHVLRQRHVSRVILPASLPGLELGGLARLLQVCSVPVVVAPKMTPGSFDLRIAS